MYPLHEDNAETWASLGADDQREFLVFGFTTPQQVDSIFIYETWNPGAIDTIYLRNSGTGLWVKVWEGTAFVGLAVSNIFKIEITQTTYTADAIRIAINSPAVPSWNEIDAVKIYKKLATGIDDKITESIKIFPNPNNGNFRIDFGELLSLKSIKVYDIMGQEISMIQNIFNKDIEINLSLDIGLYYIEISSGDQKRIKKLIIN